MPGLEAASRVGSSVICAPGWAALLVCCLLAGCATQPLLERAIRARGGAMPHVVREVESDVYVEFPGTWRWRTAFAVPDHYAWTVYTRSEPNHYLFDGRVVRAFVGDVEVTSDTAPDAPLRSHARFTAVINLDALREPGVRLAPLPATELPPEARDGLAVTFADDGATYRLGFDARGLLVWASGPLRVPPLADGPVTLRFDDFAPVSGLLLPHRTRYERNGAILLVERLRAACLDVDLQDDVFRRPNLLPACPPGHASIGATDDGVATSPPP